MPFDLCLFRDNNLIYLEHVAMASEHWMPAFSIAR